MSIQVHPSRGCGIMQAVEVRCATALDRRQLSIAVNTDVDRED